MKLYATTTSERASKGQGGNEFIKAVFTVNKDEKNCFIVIMCSHDNGDVSFAVNQRTDDGACEVYRNIYKQKGKSQKDETTKHGALCLCEKCKSGWCEQCKDYCYH